VRDGGTDFPLDSATWGERQLRVALAGAHQARNAALAAEILGALPPRLRPRWSEVEEGLAGVVWPGRLQQVELGGTRCILDVAHNPAGAVTLAAALRALDLPRPRVLLLAVLADKDLEGIVSPLLPLVDEVVVTAAPSAPAERRRTPAELERELRRLGAKVSAVADIGEAFESARGLAPRGTVLVTGSIHTVGDVLAHLGLSPYAEAAVAAPAV